MFLKDSEYVISALETILKKLAPVNFEDVERVFEKYTRKKFSWFLGTQPNVAAFLQRYSSVFRIDILSNAVSVVEGREPKKIGEMPVLPDRKYFEFTNNSGFLSCDTRGSSGNSFSKGVEKKKNSAVNETINLEEDFIEEVTKNPLVDFNYEFSYEDDI